MKRKKFLRRNTGKYLRLGRLRKKLRKWRKPKGRDNKMRLMEKGYPSVVKIGYKKNENLRGTIGGKKIRKIDRIDEIRLLSKGDSVIIGKFGGKKKIEIAKLSEERGFNILNLNVQKFLKHNN